MGGGVVIGKAAAVRGHRHVERQGHLRRNGPQLRQDVIDDLPRGGGGGADIVLPPEALEGGVVVNGQIHPLRVRLGVLREQRRRGNVRGDHPLRLKIRRGGVGPEVGGRRVRQLRIGQQVRRLSQGPQTRAQRGGGAHSVPVGPDVGENQHIVKGPQPPGGFLYGEHGHSSSGPGPRAASFSSSLRRSSKIWAPCWMESSPINWSSGV